MNEAIFSSAPIPCRPIHRILVAEDEPLIRRLITGVLLEAGYQVDAAADGAAAWDLLQQHRYDLLITDNDMPNVSGVELIGKLYAARITLPVVMVSGTMPTAELARQPWLQTAARLDKPYKIVELLATVRNVLRESSDAREPIMMPDRPRRPAMDFLRLPSICPAV